MKPSHIRLARGRIRFHVYNRGMDDHDLVVRRIGRRPLFRVKLDAGADIVVRRTLKGGRYALYCSLFAGTGDSHERKGMRAVVRVR